MYTDWQHHLDEEGTWLCEHAEGAPATRLSTQMALKEFSNSNWRGRLFCPDCGTLWRVWPELRIAKFYIEFPCKRRYQRARHTEIDRLIVALLPDFPVQVSQHQYVWPADDEELWWFQLQGDAQNSLQLEGEPYNNFSIEGSACHSFEEAVGLLTETFTRKQELH